MINKVILVGRIGKDPETRQASTPITNVTIATDETYKGEKKTQWHNVTFFGKLAEIAERYLQKGSLVYIEGKIENQSWEGQDGQKKYKTVIIANTMKMLGGGTQNSETGKIRAENTYQKPEFDRPNFPEDDLPF